MSGPSLTFLWIEMKTILFNRLPVVACCGFIFGQSSSASFDSLPTFEHADKVMHLGGYALPSLFTCIDRVQKKALDRRSLQSRA